MRGSPRNRKFGARSGEESGGSLNGARRLSASPRERKRHSASLHVSSVSTRLSPDNEYYRILSGEGASGSDSQHKMDASTSTENPTVSPLHSPSHRALRVRLNRPIHRIRVIPKQVPDSDEPMETSSNGTSAGAVAMSAPPTIVTERTEFSYESNEVEQSAQWARRPKTLSHQGTPASQEDTIGDEESKQPFHDMLEAN